jgi:hypothetical protein
MSSPARGDRNFRPSRAGSSLGALRSRGSRPWLMASGPSGLTAGSGTLPLVGVPALRSLLARFCASLAPLRRLSPSPPANQVVNCENDREPTGRRPRPQNAPIHSTSKWRRDREEHPCHNDPEDGQKKIQRYRLRKPEKTASLSAKVRVRGPIQPTFRFPFRTRTIACPRESSSCLRG